MLSLIPMNYVDVAECAGLPIPFADCFGCADLLEEAVAKAKCFTYVYV